MSDQLQCVPCKFYLKKQANKQKKNIDTHIVLLLFFFFVMQCSLALKGLWEHLSIVHNHCIMVKKGHNGLFDIFVKWLTLLVVGRRVANRLHIYT